MPVKWTPEQDRLLLIKILETHNLSVDVKKVAAAWPGGEKDKPTARAITERLVRIRQLSKTNAPASGATGTSGRFSIGKGSGSGPSSAASTPRKAHSGSEFSTPASGKRRRLEKEKEESPLKSEMDVDDDMDGEYEIEEVEEEMPTTMKGLIKKEEGEGKGVSRVLFPLTNSVPPSPSASVSGSAAVGIGDGAGNVHGQPGTGVRVGRTVGLDKNVGVSPVKLGPRIRRPSALPAGMVRYEDTLGDEDDDSGRHADVESSASDYVPDTAFGMEYDEEFA
ncbi:uncharacterized protein BJX67DRAFT_379673 [Aspergillus lucknowensis]|uniref:Uncharacterized protein n=1 Tax=Aspergillus lucknowensis TaxID=176173 RepID=A0ABR4LZJ1_9EURO